MRSFLLALVIAAMVACSSYGPPHSDYYVIFFDSAGATLLPEGRAAMARAVRDAKSGSPRAVTIKGYLTDDGQTRQIAEQRMQVVEQALLAGGLAKDLVKLAPEKTDPATFARLGDGVVVQVERGAAEPEPEPAPEAEPAPPPA
jgi:hypothetical protein